VTGEVISALAANKKATVAFTEKQVGAGVVVCRLKYNLHLTYIYADCCCTLAVTRRRQWHSQRSSSG
jgi:hypothetical protein